MQSGDESDDIRWALDEIDQVEQTAMTNPDKARRLAELYEAIGTHNFKMAWKAWQHAASLGERDAIEMVRFIKSGKATGFPPEAYEEPNG